MFNCLLTQKEQGPYLISTKDYQSQQILQPLKPILNNDIKIQTSEYQMIQP